MNNFRIRLTPLVIALLTCWGTLRSDAGCAPAEPAATSVFSPAAYLSHIKYLAGDDLGGRGTGSEGGRRAAEYIAEQFQSAGLQPGGVDGSWFQPFEVTVGKRVNDELASLKVQEIERSWRVREDWIPLPFSEFGAVEGPLAFAGYGIQAPMYDYDDYSGFDAGGKVLLIFRYEPRATDPQADFGGQTPSRFAPFWRKARSAAQNGAKALLIVNPPDREPAQDTLYDFDIFSSEQTYALPMVSISRAMANTLLARAGLPDLTTLQQSLDTQRKPLSRDMGLNVKLETGLEPNRVPARNVLGLLPGAGDTSETIVVGAHYDHLGIQPSMHGNDRTPQIHNGADDNASGTAGVIELARAASEATKLRRNVLFIAFDGEELGLCGSREFVEHPTVAFDDIRAMINLDMIGRAGSGKFSMLGAPTAAEFAGLIEKYAGQVGLNCRTGGLMAGGSDHAPFAARRIPVLFAFTGVHKEYHRPEDDWQLIDAEGAAKVLRLCYGVLAELANMESGPAYTEPPPEAREEEEIRPAVEEKKEAGQDASSTQDSDSKPSRAKLRVRLGVIPDVPGDGKPGMVVQSVIEGSPAALAGMQNGDRVMKIAGEEIRDIYAYMRVLEKFDERDETDIVVLRDGREQKLRVKFQAAETKPGH
jgi:membrane-associated protease RseP (regulator of RpoE activity)